MSSAGRFAAGLALVVGSAFYAEVPLPGLVRIFSQVPYVGPELAAVPYLLPVIVVSLAWTFGYVGLFGGLAPRPKLEGKKIGTCEKCGFAWEFGKTEAVRFWFRTKDEGGELRPDTQYARACAKCGHRLGQWEPVVDRKEVELPERMRLPPKYKK